MSQVSQNQVYHEECKDINEIFFQLILLCKPINAIHLTVNYYQIYSEPGLVP